MHIINSAAWLIVSLCSQIKAGVVLTTPYCSSCCVFCLNGWVACVATALNLLRRLFPHIPGAAPLSALLCLPTCLGLPAWLVCLPAFVCRRSASQGSNRLAEALGAPCAAAGVPGVLQLRVHLPGLAAPGCHDGQRGDPAARLQRHGVREPPEAACAARGRDHHAAAAADKLRDGGVRHQGLHLAQQATALNALPVGRVRGFIVRAGFGALVHEVVLDLRSMWA